jgi:hypothetical protein
MSEGLTFIIILCLIGIVIPWLVAGEDDSEDPQ